MDDEKMNVPEEPEISEEPEIKGETDVMVKAEVRVESDVTGKSGITDESKIKDETTIVVNKRVIAKIGGIIGAALVILGSIIPMYSISLFGMSKSFQYISGDGKVLCVMAVATIILILIKKQMFTIIPTIVSIAIFGYDLSGIVGETGSLINYSIGFYVLILGLLILAASVVLSIIGKWDRIDKKSNITAIIILAASIVVIVLAELLGQLITTNSTYKKALASMQKKDYNTAIEEFTELKGYRDSKDKKIECQYLLAKQYLSKGYFEDARELFQKLKDYKDSSDQIIECNYLEAKDYIDNGDYEEARKLLSEMTDYKDTDELLKECDFEEAKEKCEYDDTAVQVKEIMKIKDYEPAKKYCMELINSSVDSYLESEAYDEAIKLLEDVSKYIDVTELLNKCKYEKVKLLYKDKEYDEALKLVKDILDYKDAKDWQKKIKKSQKAYKEQHSRPQTPTIGEFYDSTDYSSGGDGTMCRIDWDPVSGADGYEIWVSQTDYVNSPYTETEDTLLCYYETGASDSIHVEFKVRAYKYVDGEIKYSDWTAVKTYDLNG